MCEDCHDKVPSYGIRVIGKEEDSKKSWCAACASKHPGAERITRETRSCIDCKLKIPSYGYKVGSGKPLEGKKQWCSGCGKTHEGAQRLNNQKMCEDCGLKVPSYGTAAERKKRWCAPCGKKNHSDAERLVPISGMQSKVIFFPHVRAPREPKVKKAKVPKAPKEPKAQALKKAKDPDEPVRPPTAYIEYTNDRKPELMKAEPQPTISACQKTMADEWKNLAADKKQKYNDIAATTKAVYDAAKKVYDAKLIATAPAEPPSVAAEAVSPKGDSSPKRKAAALVVDAKPKPPSEDDGEEPRSTRSSPSAVKKPKV